MNSVLFYIVLLLRKYSITKLLVFTLTIFPAFSGAFTIQTITKLSYDQDIRVRSLCLNAIDSLKSTQTIREKPLTVYF